MSRGARQAGFTLITAVFLIVILALVAAAMVRLLTIERQAALLSLLGGRAHFAAQSAMERAVHGAVTGGCAAVPGGPFTLSGGATDGYTVTLSCTERTVTEGPDNYAVYALVAEASRGASGQPEFVSRTLRATVTTAP